MKKNPPSLDIYFERHQSADCVHVDVLFPEISVFVLAFCTKN